MSPEFFIGTLLPWFVAFFLITLILLHLIALPRILKSFWKLPLATRLALFIILGISIFIRFSYVPNTHRIYYDEDRYLGNAVSFARYGKAHSIELATPQQHIIGVPDQSVRLTVPVLHGLVLKIFGFSEHNLFTLSKILSVIYVVYIFILSKQLFRSNIGAIVTSVGIGLIPIQVYWSTSLALDPYFALFAILGAIVTIRSATEPNKFNHLFTTIVLFLLICIRLEAVIILIIYVSMFIMTRKGAGMRIWTKDDHILLYVLLPLILVRGFASLSVLGQKWCCADALPLEAFSLKYVIRNFIPNLMYLLHSKEVPFFISLPALFFLFKSRSWQTLSLGLWIVLFFTLYSFYYAGLFVTPEFSGSYARYFLIILPIVLLLFGQAASLGIALVMKKRFSHVVLVIVFVLYSFLIYRSFRQYQTLVTKAPAMFENVDNIPIEVHRFLEKVYIPKTPANALLIHPITNTPVLYGKGAVYYEYFLEDRTTINFVKNYIKSGKPVFAVNGSQCELTPYRCRKISSIFRFEKTNLAGVNPLGFEIDRVLLR